MAPLNRAERFLIAAGIMLFTGGACVATILVLFFVKG